MALISRDDAMDMAKNFARWMAEEVDKKIFDALGGSQKMCKDDGKFFMPKRILESLEPSEIAVAQPSSIFLSGNNMYEIVDGTITSVKMYKSRAFNVCAFNKHAVNDIPKFYRVIGADYDMHQKIEKLEVANDALAKEVETLRNENSRLRELINTMDVLCKIREFRVFYEMKKAANDEQGKG